MAAGSNTSNHTLKGRLAVYAAALLLAGCGGGGGGGSEAPQPTPTPNITPAAGGTVSSSDNMLTLEVGAGKASASVAASLAKAAAPAAAASSPDYVADSTYLYTGDDLVFTSPATWVLISGAAATGTAGPSAALFPSTHKRALVVGSNIPQENYRLCEPAYAAQYGRTPQVSWRLKYEGHCPAACSEGPEATDTLWRCEPPAQWIYFIPNTDSCFAGSTDISGDPAFSGVAAALQMKVCKVNDTVAPPVIAQVPGHPLGGCVVNAGRFICDVSALQRNAALSIFQDRVPPQVPPPITTHWALDTVNPDPDILRLSSTEAQVTVPTGGSKAVELTIQAFDANDPVGLRQVELFEIPRPTARPLFNGNPVFVVPTRLWGAAPQGQSLPPGKKGWLGSDGTFTFNFSATDPAERLFFARATDWAGNATSSAIYRIKRVSPAGPVIGTFTATPTSLPAQGGTVTLAWSINNATAATITPVVGSVAPGTGSQQVVVTQTTTFTLNATNAGGSATPRTVNVNVSVDTTAPTVSLVSTSQNVVAPASITLTANASDEIGVTKVDFYEGATLLGTRTAAPFTWDLAYTSGNVGNHSYTARAFDAASNSAFSAPLVVQVGLPSSADRYVSPVTGSDAADGLSAATAYKTLTKAFATVGSSGTVWLANGTYTAANEGLNTGVSTLLAVPAGRTVRALSDGQAVLNFGLSFAANGSAVGLAFDGLAPGAGMTGIDASAGTVSLSKLSFINLGNANTGGGGFSANAALRVHGTAMVTLSAGAGNLLVMGTGVQVGTLVFDSAQLTLNGGTLQPTGACGGGCVAQLKVGGTAHLVLDGTVVALSTTSDVLPQPMGLLSDSGSLTIRNASLSQSGSSTPRDLVIANATSTVTLANSTVTSTFHNLVGFQNGTPTANLQNLTVSGAVGRVAGPTFSQSGPSPTINVTGGNYSNITGVNGFNSTVLDVSTGAAGTINITGGTFANNQNVVDLSGAGVRNLRVRGSTFTGNSACGGACFTFLLGGDASSVFDLGTLADAGANTIQAITTGRGVAVNTNAAVTVNAVGNTWKAGIQGANSSGQYTLGTAPCGTSSCSVSTGAGANYTLTTGAIRLAGN